MIISFLVLAVFIAIPIGVIIGIYKIIKIPKPPAGSSTAEVQWWYNGGWKEAKREAELRYLAEEEKKNADDAFMDEILDYLKLGQRTEAIKRYQEYHECGFTEAKYAIYEIDYQTGYERVNDSENSQ